MRATVFPRNVTLAILFSLGTFAFVASSHAQETKSLRGKPSKEQILEALSPKSSAGSSGFKTRGLSVGSSSSQPVAADAPVANAKPEARALDLEVRFELNSDQLTDDGKEVLDQLGAALKSDALADAKSIMLEGHADRSGNPAYNQLLSVRRAHSVKNYLATKQQVPAKKLRASGKGSSEPADPKNPEDPINRRVRVIVNS
jgi:outer membrane protein OmpA-like peptidoglycan-associated protein